MTAPVVSVVLPTYNRLELVREAVASVYAQTFASWELIVVDDGSDEPTRQFLSKLPDSRTTVIFRSHTGVPAVVRNEGIARARGRYVAFLDSDDRWAPEKLQRQLELMESQPGRRWSYTGLRRIDAAGCPMNTRLIPWVPYAGAILEPILRIDAQLAMPTVMADLALVRELGGFDENLCFIEDYDLWARLAMRSEVSFTAEPLAEVRAHPQQFTLDRVGSLVGWVRFFTKMETLVESPRLRSVCRRGKRDRLLSLAAQQAREGNWLGLREALAAAVRARAWRPRGWLRVAKAVALSGYSHRSRSPV